MVISDELAQHKEDLRYLEYLLLNEHEDLDSSLDFVTSRTIENLNIPTSLSTIRTENSLNIRIRNCFLNLFFIKEKSWRVFDLIHFTSSSLKDILANFNTILLWNEFSRKGIEDLKDIQIDDSLEEQPEHFMFLLLKWMWT